MVEPGTSGLLLKYYLLFGYHIETFSYSLDFLIVYKVTDMLTHLGVMDHSVHWF